MRVYYPQIHSNSWGGKEEFKKESISETALSLEGQGSAKQRIEDWGPSHDSLNTRSDIPHPRPSTKPGTGAELHQAGP